MPTSREIPFFVVRDIKRKKFSTQIRIVVDDCNIVQSRSIGSRGQISRFGSLFLQTDCDAGVVDCILADYI